MKLLDLCAGIGGIRIGFERVFQLQTYSCEIDKYAQQTYQYNFQSLPYPDIKTLTSTHTDILTAGFPCQAFSQAGQKKGFSDIRGTIFFDIIRLIKS